MAQAICRRRKTIGVGTTYLGTLTDLNPKYLLVATDGLPNCGTENQNGDNSAATVRAVAAALTAGYPTFVVGIATTSDAMATATLNAMAMAGGEAQTGGTTSYYNVTDTASLEAALNKIVGIVASCKISLATAPTGLTDGERRRLAKLGKALGRKALQQVATIATPDTILRWYRELVAAKYDGSKKRGPGRPRKAGEIVRLLVEMATRNTTWGYTRLRDALNNLGYKIGRTTVERILSEKGIEPAPERKRQYSWATFIKAHLGGIAGMDFFTVEVVTVLGLVRYHVLFVIDIGSRMVEVVGLARDPGGEWMKQMGRNLLEGETGFSAG